MQRDLSFNLHVLTARLDRAADRILKREVGISYPRFLLLFMVREYAATTQRALAQRLGVTEPSASRMTASLAEEGLLRIGAAPAGGNRHHLSLTRRGTSLVKECCGLLEARIVDLVEGSGVPYGAYARQTKQLLAALDSVEQERAGWFAGSRPSAGADAR